LAEARQRKICSQHQKVRRSMQVGRHGRPEIVCSCLGWLLPFPPIPPPQTLKVGKLEIGAEKLMNYDTNTFFDSFKRSKASHVCDPEQARTGNRLAWTSQIQRPRPRQRLPKLAWAKQHASGCSTGGEVCCSAASRGTLGQEQQ
jgi:hypothetical protein